jgi:hypothetical protein
MGIISGLLHAGSERDRSGTLLGMSSSPAYLYSTADKIGSVTTVKAYSFFVGTPFCILSE